MNNPSLSADPHHLVDSQECSINLVLVLRVQHFLELIEKIVVAVFLVLGKVLLELLGSLNLLLLLVQVSNYPNQFYVLENDLSVVRPTVSLLLADNTNLTYPSICILLVLEE